MQKVEQPKQELVNIFDFNEKQPEPTTTIVTLKPQPLAPAKLEKKICQIIQQLLNYKQIRKGVNQVMKAMHKGGIEVVILAADCDPLQIIMTLPGLCEQRNIPYCFVASKNNLGRACGIKRPVVAVCITFQPEATLKSQILELKDNIEQLFV